MIMWRIALSLTFGISLLMAENYEENVTVKRLKDQLIELERLEEKIEDSSFPSIDKIKEKFKSLVILQCNYEIENVNLTLTEIYQAFENQENKILQNKEEIKVMKEIVKNLAKLLPDTSVEKADVGVKSMKKVEFKQQETLPTSFQLENSANKSQTVQTRSHTKQYSSNTKKTTKSTTTKKAYPKTRAGSFLGHEKDLPAGVDDCETPPLHSTYCHQYKILWYFNSEEGRCNRFRKGCEETFRNSYTNERECLDKCVRPGFEERKACFLPRSPGICKGIERSWYFDWQDNRCKAFIYTGCLGNQNRFSDEKSCWQQCGSTNLQLAEEPGFKTYNRTNADYESRQISKTLDKAIKQRKVPTHPLHYLAISNKVQQGHQKIETTNSIQSTFSNNEFESHYPDYIIPSSQQKSAQAYAAKKGYQKLETKNSIQRTFPEYKRLYLDYIPFKKQKSAQDHEANKVQPGHQKLETKNSIQSTFPEGHYADYTAFNQQSSHQAYAKNPKTVNRQKTIFKESFKKRNRKYRQFLYTYNDKHKRRSKVSKTQNLRVELHAPNDIEAGNTFKLKCIVSGSLAEAVEIIWDRDDATDKRVEWKKGERTDVNKLSYIKTSTLYVTGGIYSSVRFTCLVSCYDPQAAGLLPTKLKEREKVERVENYLCAFDSVKLKPKDWV